METIIFFARHGYPLNVRRKIGKREDILNVDILNVKSQNQSRQVLANYEYHLTETRTEIYYFIHTRKFQFTNNLLFTIVDTLC